MTATERRDLERFKLSLLSRVNVQGKQKSREATELLSRDISADGAFISTSQPFEVGTRVEMDLIIRMERLDESDDRAALVNLTGTITRTDENGMAIRFDDTWRISRLNESRKGPCI